MKLIAVFFVSALLVTGQTGASQVSLRQSGTGAVITNVQSKVNQIVSVTDFGADPTGTKDSAAAITAAIASLTTSGGTLYFPIGKYKINSTVYVPNNGIVLKGTGSGSLASPPGASVIDCRANTNCIAFAKGSDVTGASGDIQNWGMEDITISITNNVNIGVNALFIGNSHVNGHLTNVRVENYASFVSGAGVGRDGIALDSGSNSGGFISGMTWTNVNVIGAFNLGVQTDNVLFGITQWIWNGGQVVSTISPPTAGTAGLYFRRVAQSVIQNVDIEGWDIGTVADTNSWNLYNLRLEGNTLDYQFSVSACQNNLMGSYFTITETTADCNSRTALMNLTSSIQEWVMANDTNFPSGSTQEFNGTITSNMTLARAQGAGRSITLTGSGANTGYFEFQAGPVSDAFGGALRMYGHSNGSHPGDVVAGISSGSGGAFRVNSAALDDGTDWFKVTNTAVIAPTSIKVGPASTFAVLTAAVTCAPGTEGSMASVTDSTTNTWGATITGSGSNHVGAYCDGSAWTVFSK